MFLFSFNKAKKYPEKPWAKCGLTLVQVDIKYEFTSSVISNQTKTTS